MSVNTRPSPGQQLDLVDMMKENLAHARHVENERMTFMSLFLVGVGLIMDFSIGLKQPIVSLILGVLMLGLALVSTKLLQRWNDIFSSHMKIVKGIVMQLEGLKTDTDPNINRLYLFDNKVYTGARDDTYTNTAKYFLLFNKFTCAVIIVFILYAAWELLGEKIIWLIGS